MGFAQRPMINRILQLDNNIPLHFLIASDEKTISSDTAQGIKTIRQRDGATVTVDIISNTGHILFIGNFSFAIHYDLVNKIIRKNFKKSFSICFKNSASFKFVCYQLLNKANIWKYNFSF
jgi:hypothetical protein